MDNVHGLLTMVMPEYNTTHLGEGSGHGIVSTDVFAQAMNHMH